MQQQYFNICFEDFNFQFSKCSKGMSKHSPFKSGLLSGSGEFTEKVDLMKMEEFLLVADLTAEEMS